MHYTCCSSNTNMRCIDAIVATRVNIVADGEACRLPNERAILRTDRRRLTWSTGLPLFHHPDDCLRLLSALQHRPPVTGYPSRRLRPPEHTADHTRRQYVNAASVASRLETSPGSDLELLQEGLRLGFTIHELTLLVNHTGLCIYIPISLPRDSGSLAGCMGHLGSSRVYTSTTMTRDSAT